MFRKMFLAALVVATVTANAVAQSTTGPRLVYSPTETYAAQQQEIVTHSWRGGAVQVMGQGTESARGAQASFERAVQINADGRDLALKLEARTPRIAVVAQQMRVTSVPHVVPYCAPRYGVAHTRHYHTTTVVQQQAPRGPLPAPSPMPPLPSPQGPTVVYPPAAPITTPVVAYPPQAPQPHPTNVTVYGGGQLQQQQQYAGQAGSVLAQPPTVVPVPQQQWQHQHQPGCGCQGVPILPTPPHARYHGVPVLPPGAALHPGAGVPVGPGAPGAGCRGVPILPDPCAPAPPAGGPVPVPALPTPAPPPPPPAAPVGMMVSYGTSR